MTGDQSDSTGAVNKDDVGIGPSLNADSRTVSFRGLFEVAAYPFKLMLPEERILAVTWLLGFGVMFYSRTGVPNLQDTFQAYLRHFAPYLVALFVISRLFFAADAKMSVYNRPRIQRLRYFLFGPQKGYHPDKWDALFSGSRRYRAAPLSNLKIDLVFVRCFILFFINVAMYTNIKVRYPFVNQITSGDWLYQLLDDYIFGRGFIHAIEDWFRNNAEVAAYFQKVYMHDYIWFVVLLSVFYLRKDSFGLRWIFGSVVVTYMVSILITTIYPSIGPCFMYPEKFKWLMDSEMRIGITQERLTAFYQFAAIEVQEGRGLKAIPFVGIAAFPSLHVGHMVILFFVSLRKAPLFAIWAAWVAIATFIATIGFGWHYAVDGLAGLIVAGGVTEILFRILKKNELDKNGALNTENDPIRESR